MGNSDRRVRMVYLCSVMSDAAAGNDTAAEGLIHLEMCLLLSLVFREGWLMKAGA